MPSNDTKVTVIDLQRTPHIKDVGEMVELLEAALYKHAIPPHLELGYQELLAQLPELPFIYTYGVKNKAFYVETKPFSVLPHLACDADLDKLPYPVMGFPKYDGVRGTSIVGRGFSGRSLKPFANKLNQAVFSRNEYSGLDGELLAGLPSDEGLCGNTTSALGTIEGTVQCTYHVFDLLVSDTFDKRYYDRYQSLRLQLEKEPKPFVELIPFKWIHNKEEALAFYHECLSKNYEGTIWRDPNGLHKNGRTTLSDQTYTRSKPSKDAEAIIVGIEEAMTNTNEAKVNELGHLERSSHKANKVPKGMVGVMWGLDLVTGKVIKIGPGKMTHAERTHFWNHPEELLRKISKYRSMDYKVKENERFARHIVFRDVNDLQPGLITDEILTKVEEQILTFQQKANANA